MMVFLGKIKEKIKNMTWIIGAFLIWTHMVFLWGIYEELKKNKGKIKMKCKYIGY